MDTKYRMTLSDRMGADAYLLLRFVAWGVAIGIVTAVIATFQAIGEGVSGTMVLVRAVTWGVAAAALVIGGTAGWLHVAGEAWSLWLAPRGSGRGVDPDFSLEDAMLVRGDVAGALHSFERLIATRPTDARVRIRAADVYAGPGARPRRARELFQEARGMRGAPASIDIYASNRLVDLYLGVLNDGRAARAELRGLAQRYPGTPVGAQAADALRRLGPADAGGQRVE